MTTKTAAEIARRLAEDLAAADEYIRTLASHEGAWARTHWEWLVTGQPGEQPAAMDGVDPARAAEVREALNIAHASLPPKE